MFYLGVFLLSFPVWLVVAAYYVRALEGDGKTHSAAIDSGVDLMCCGLGVTGVVAFGLWCISL